ncbi:hypothetical protein QE152_g23600 [Popillia japonica]|uniref:Uncharacterized protein n=1 Tax=Popillia japonica TaxID=7064 RepID=A0AAW1KGN7_POPJA
MDKERKREREEEDNGAGALYDSGEKLFSRSKKTIRSPDLKKLENKEGRDQKLTIDSASNYKSSRKEKEMDELKEMMRQIMRDMKQNTDELKDEIKEIKQEMRKKEEKWEREKTELVQRIQILENRLENDEKQKRKNNIIIKGIKAGENQIKEGVVDFLKQELQIQANIKEAYKIDREKHYQMVRVELESFQNKIDIFQNKIDIMKAKSKLKNTKIYIDNDLTKEERYIQKELRNVAREERENGNEVKIGYQKMTINGKQYRCGVSRREGCRKWKRVEQAQKTDPKMQQR